MKRLIIVLFLVLAPITLAAQSMGIFFEPYPGKMHIYPMPFVEFNGYVYGHSIGCYMTAIEFMVTVPVGVALNGFEIPEGSLNLGDPGSGLAITYWPPLIGHVPGYNLLCTLQFMAVGECWDTGGILADLPISIVAHPATGRIGGTCYPDNNIFDIAGQTSIVCPFDIAIEERSWGAIKAMFQ